MDPLYIKLTLRSSISLLFVILINVSVFSQQKSIEITEHIWTDSIDETGSYKKSLKNNVSCENIILWVKIKMGKAWIDSIKNNNGLPLRFQWFHNVGPGWSSKFVSTPIDTLIYSQQRLKLDSLKDKTPNNYKMEWVVWSQNVEKLEAGRWNVRVVKSPSTVIKDFTINIAEH